MYGAGLKAKKFRFQALDKQIKALDLELLSLNEDKIRRTTTAELEAKKAVLDASKAKVSNVSFDYLMGFSLC